MLLRLRPTASPWLSLLAASLLTHCGASGEGNNTIGTVTDPSGGSSGRTSVGTPAGDATGLATGNDLITGLSGVNERGQTVTAIADPCVTVGCGPGQTCVLENAVASCSDNSCEQLQCAETEECRPHERGGNVCVNLFCAVDVDCDPSDYCSSNGTCQPDVCSGGQSSCDGQAVRVCASNGGQEEQAYTCGSTSFFATQCEQPQAGNAACSCQDDWDCPGFTVCEVDRCVGTGFAPTCTIAPGDFADALPQVEMHWGGDSSVDDLAHDGTANSTTPAPWAESSHVTATPMVANLDDDNGDGLINELDFPEVVFLTYQLNGVDQGAVLRAVHAGGPDRGRDFFAICGTTVWQEGDPLPVGPCNGGNGARSRSPAAIGDLDGDGSPEIVFVTVNNAIRIVSANGSIAVSPNLNNVIAGGGISLSPTIANLDFEGLPEIVLGTTVLTLGQTAAGALFIRNILRPAAGTNGQNDIGGPMACVADVTGDNGQELLAGTTLYRMPDNVAACPNAAINNNPPCQGELEVVWTAGGNLLANNGLCAIADVWGANANQPPGPSNPPDGTPEAIVVANGNLLILDAATGTLIDQRDLDPSITQQRRGGAPNVDDFDGDGFLEIATALSSSYVVVDLQAPTANGGACPAWPATLPRNGANPNPPRTAAGACADDTDCGQGTVCNRQAGQCVCLHNGWQRSSDDESALTSSSIFDFNGDGAAEVVYNDECDLRIYSGSSGEIAFSEFSRNRTWTDNPVVADVDNDGNAELITVSNVENLGGTPRCIDDAALNAPRGPSGVRVWGDAQDTWVPARRIWNQQSYHVTNVTESGAIPVHPPESWQQYNGRTFNTYRSQPRSFGVAPDLAIQAIGIFSPNAQCGVLDNEVNLSFEVENRGDLRVGAGVQVSFFGTWNGVETPLLNAAGNALQATLAEGVDAGRSLFAVVEYDVANQTGQTTLPDSVRVAVDTGGAQGSSFGAERECNEANNSLVQVVEPGEQLADLTVAAGQALTNCSASSVDVALTVTNSGVGPAAGVVVQIFAGNPTQGGTLMGEQALADAVPPGGSVELTTTVTGFPIGRSITLWAAVDPNNAVAECNEGDNIDPADNEAFCPGLR